MISFKIRREETEIDDELFDDTRTVYDEPLLEETGGSYLKVTIICFLISFSGFVLGWDIAVVGSLLNMTDFRQRFGQYNDSTGDYKFDNIRTGLISGFYSIAAVFGCLILPKLVDKIGKRRNIIVGNVIYIIGSLIYISAMTKWYQIFVARLVIGFALGGLSVLSPSLVSEMAPLEIRGMLLSLYQILSCFGLAVGNIVCYGTNFISHSSMQWRLPLLISFVWQILMLVGLILLPESQTFLVQKGNFTGLLKSLKQIHPSKNDDQLYAILEDLKKKLSNDNDTKLQINAKPKILFRLICGILIQLFQGFTGINYFFYYSTTIFQGVGLQSSFIASIILSSVYAFSSFISIPITNNFKRKTITITGSILILCWLLLYVLLATLALYPNGPSHESSIIVGKLVIMFSCFYIFTFSVTWGPMAYVIMNEIFPLKYNKVGVTFAMCSNWICTFLVSFFTPFITSKIGFKYGCVFIGCTFVSIFFILFCIPETKGLTLDEIDYVYEHNNSFLRTVKHAAKPDEIEIPTFKLKEMTEEDLEGTTPANDFIRSAQEEVGDYFAQQ